MKRIATLFLAACLCAVPVFSVGCGAIQQQISMSIEGGAQAATVGALYALKATPLVTAQVRDIASGLAVITTGGTIDYAAVRQEILDQIAQHFTPEQQVILIQTIGIVSAIVIGFLPPAPTDKDYLFYTHAAAVGVVAGCDFYAQQQVPRSKSPLARPAYLEALRVRPHPELK